MEINGEVNIEIDQYADVSIEIDTEDLAETLCQDLYLVDDVVLHNYVDERMDDYELKVQVDDLSTEVDELRVNVAHAQAEFEGELQDLRDQVSELEPDNNYVRINDLRKIIEEIVRAEICVAFAAGHHKMQDRLYGIDIEKRENQ